MSRKLVPILRFAWGLQAFLSLIEPKILNRSGWLRAVRALTSRLIFHAGVNWSCLRINQLAFPPAQAKEQRLREEIVDLNQRCADAEGRSTPCPYTCSPGDSVPALTPRVAGLRVKVWG